MRATSEISKLRHVVGTPRDEQAGNHGHRVEENHADPTASALHPRWRGRRGRARDVVSCGVDRVCVDERYPDRGACRAPRPRGSRVGCSLQPRRSVPSHLRQGPNLPPVEPLQGDAHQDVRRPRARGSRRRRRRGQQQARPRTPARCPRRETIGTASRTDPRRSRKVSRAPQTRAPDLPLPLFFRRVATCGGDKQVFLWDVTTGQKIRRFRGHDSAVNAVRFAADDWLCERRLRPGLRRLRRSIRLRPRSRPSPRSATPPRHSQCPTPASSPEASTAPFEPSTFAPDARTSTTSDARWSRGDIRRRRVRPRRSPRLARRSVGRGGRRRPRGVPRRTRGGDDARGRAIDERRTRGRSGEQEERCIFTSWSTRAWTPSSTRIRRGRRAG